MLDKNASNLVNKQLTTMANYTEEYGDFIVFKKPRQFIILYNYFRFTRIYIFCDFVFVNVGQYKLKLCQITAKDLCTFFIPLFAGIVYIICDRRLRCILACLNQNFLFHLTCSRKNLPLAKKLNRFVSRTTSILKNLHGNFLFLNFGTFQWMCIFTYILFLFCYE